MKGIKEKIMEDLESKNKGFSEECSSKFFTEEERASVAEFTTIKKFKKAQIIIREGQVVNTCYHVNSGCLRQYRIVNGEERTIFFYSEGQSLLSITQRNSLFIANYNVDCIEDTETSIMTSENENKLYARHPNLESLSRKSLEVLIKEYQNLMSDFMTSTPEERYLKLIEEQPTLLTRVPQYQLASYVGVKPESLSRIRKRLAHSSSSSSS